MANVEHEDIRKAIRLGIKLRTVRGLSREQLRVLAGFTSESHVRRIEQEGSNPTILSVHKYLNALGVKLKVEEVPMKFICFFNHAGGSSKTTTCREVGINLAQRGYRVLLIDCDPQANLTGWLGAAEDIKLEDTVYPVLMRQSNTFSRILHCHGVDLVPSTLELSRFELVSNTVMLWQQTLMDAVRNLEGYDFVMMDAPASLGGLAVAAACAADHIIVPLPSETKGVDGLPTVVQTIREYRLVNKNIQLSGYVITKYDGRIRVQKDYAELYQDQLDPKLILGQIRYRPNVYGYSTASGTPVMCLTKNEDLRHGLDEAQREIHQLTERFLSHFHLPTQVEAQLQETGAEHG